MAFCFGLKARALLKKELAEQMQWVRCFVVVLSKFWCVVIFFAVYFARSFVIMISRFLLFERNPDLSSFGAEYFLMLYAKNAFGN